MSGHDDPAPNGALIMPSLGSFHKLPPHERCACCRKCVTCSSLQCGSKPSDRRCRKHRGRK